MLDRETGTYPDWLQPGIIITKGGLRIGLLGATAPYPAFYSLLGWDVVDPIAAVREQAERLRPQADVLIVLSHLGLPTDRKLAEEVEGLDLILGGHTHHQLDEPLLVGRTMLCGAGKFGERMGRVEIGRDRGTGGVRLRGGLLSPSLYPQDPAAAALIAEHGAAASRSMDRVCAVLSTPLLLDTDRESPLANLLAAGVRRWTSSDIGIVNAGQLLGGLAAGPITEAQLHSLCPSPINPCRMRLRGREIRIALEQSLLPEFTGMEIRGFGFRGRVLGTLAVDGLDVEWTDEAQPGARIVRVLIGGRELDDEEEYSVGTLDMFTFGVGYLTLKEGRSCQYFLPEFIRHVLALELGREESIQDSFRNRIRMRN